MEEVGVAMVSILSLMMLPPIYEEADLYALLANSRCNLNHTKKGVKENCQQRAGATNERQE